MTSGPHLVLDADRRLGDHVRRLAAQRMVFFAGRPGTGKSLLVHQLGHAAAAAGRRVHLLQWDVARPVFEAAPAGRRYPLADGVTHAVIRKAAGLWVRDAVAGWNARHGGPQDLLIGETPLIGSRFVELAQRRDDAAERVLTEPSCRFVITVPSAHVKRHLELARERRSVRPRHPREREDAPPPVLRRLWGELAAAAVRLGLRVGAAGYDADVYRRVYETVLRRRHTDVAKLDIVLPVEELSVYEFAVPPSDLVPAPAEAERLIREVERAYADPRVLDQELAGWYEV